MRAMALVDHNIDQALELFTSSLLRVSEYTKKHIPTGICHKDTLWFVMLSPCLEYSNVKDPSLTGSPM